MTFYRRQQRVSVCFLLNSVSSCSSDAHEYPGTDGGKQAHYMLRWVNTRGETGPWSETATATIGA